MEKHLIVGDQHCIHEQLKVGIEGITNQCAALQELIKTLKSANASLELGTGEEQTCASKRVDPVSEQSLAGREGAGPQQWAPAAGVSLSDQKEESLGGERRSYEAVRPVESLTLREGRDRVEKGMISAAVGKCGGNMARASEMLGVSRSALYDLMKKHGLFKGNRHPSDHYAHGTVTRHELAEKADCAEPI